MIIVLASPPRGGTSFALPPNVALLLLEKPCARNTTYFFCSCAQPAQVAAQFFFRFPFRVRSLRCACQVANEVDMA